MTSLTHKIFNKVDGRRIDLHISISSGLVSVALVYSNTNELPTVLASLSRTVPFDHNPQPQEIKKRVLITLEALLSDFVVEIKGMYELNDLYDSHQTIHGITIGLSPLWLDVNSEARQAVYESSRVITDQMISELIAPENAEETIDISVVRAHANKYEINPKDVAGMETPELELQVMYSSLSLSEKENLLDILLRHFAVEETKNIEFVPSTKVMLFALTELYGITDHYSIVHFDAEDTQVITRSTEDGLFIETLPYGLGEFKRQIIKEGMAPDFIHAKDMLRGYYERALEDSVSEQLSYISDVEGQVLENLITSKTSLQSPLFVISSQVGENFLMQDAITESKGHPTVTKVDIDNFSQYITTIGDYVVPSVETLLITLYAQGSQM